MPRRASGLLTVRAGAEVCRAVGEDAGTVAGAGRRFGISWPSAMDRVRAYGLPLVDDPARLEMTTAVGVDETTFLHAGRRRRTVYVTGIIDLDRGRLLDVVPGRSGRVLTDWLFEQSEAWRDQITVAAIDAFRGYANEHGRAARRGVGHGPLPHDPARQPGAGPGSPPGQQHHLGASGTPGRSAVSDPPDRPGRSGAPRPGRLGPPHRRRRQR